MYNKTILDLKSVFIQHPFVEARMASTELYVYEGSEINANGHKITTTQITDLLPLDRHFKIKNTIIDNVIAHICIDGDFVSYGQEKYDLSSSAFSDGRPDSIIFDSKTFLFLELKLNQEDISWGKEDTKWKNLLSGTKQILDFVTFLRNNGFEIKHNYSSIKAVICMRFEPDFSILTRGNAARNTEIFKISMKLGFEVIAHNHSIFYEIS
jgi:hypothetical protein